jgi:hypothetical protein
MGVTDDYYAYKADGIFDNTFINTANSNTRAMGHAANGGGGGSVDNGGGGGGGNYTAGGQGGHGWTCSNPGAGGLGGLALSGYITNARLFMGGGGGGGQGNNGVQTSGVSGGGIVLLEANVLAVNGNNTISANGSIATNSGNDGAGGGGAGGSIVITINSNSVTCNTGTLNVTANGGNGGNVNDGGAHGAGGAGGQGVVFLNVSLPPCITITTNNGSSGCNNNNNPCTDAAGSASGSNNAGVFTNNLSSPLPIELAYFTAACKNNHIEIDWKTITESNLADLIVEKSSDGANFTELCDVKGTGNSSVPKLYACYDISLFEEISYYRLKEIDKNGSIRYFNSISVLADACLNESINQIIVFPNPTISNQLNINTVTENADDIVCEIMDITGKLCKTQHITLQKGINNYNLNLEGLATGIYLLKVYSNVSGETQNIKFIKGI